MELAEKKSRHGENMADLSAAQRRIMLKSYEQQLNVARHLASFKARARIREAMLNGDDETRRRLEEGIESIDPDPSVKRGDFVKQAAEALFISLVFSGDSNPITEDIRADLSRALDKDVEFTYPPGGRMRLVIKEGDSRRPLTEEEQRLITPVLRHVTSQKMETIMQGKAEKKSE